MSTMITRRSLVRGSALTLAGTLATRPLSGMQLGQSPVEWFHELPAADDTRLQQLIHAAVDAAMAAGASYADARLTTTQQFKLAARSIWPDRRELMCFGVRTVYQGYWGFAASTVWNTTEAGRLGRNAVANAKANVLGKVRNLQMAPLASPRSGEWMMPVKDDPFEMALEEIIDYLNGLESYISRLPYVAQKDISASFSRQRKTFGSSLGQFVSQRVYRTGGGISFIVSDNNKGRQSGGSIEEISMAGMGFEYFRDQPLRQLIDEKHEEVLRDLELPVIPVDVGKYSVLFDSTGAAGVVSESIGAATEVDRVMGYEANAGGTSYIIDPDETLGALKVGTPALTVSASRSIPGGCAWTRWDDEGVEPQTFPIVRDGLLVNLQTHREGGGWIASYYQKTRQPMTSFGCAYAPDAMTAPLVATADLTVQPDPTATKTKDTLRAAMDRGIEWRTPGVVFDFQKSTGYLRGLAYDVKGGKRVAIISDAGVLFRSTELWNNLQYLGGLDAVRRIGKEVWKGQPAQLSYHSVATPPMVCKDMTVIDVKRKA